MHHSVDLIIFTGRDRNVTPGGDNFYLRTAGQWLGKIVSKVIVAAEDILPVVIGANFRHRCRASSSLRYV